MSAFIELLRVNKDELNANMALKSATTFATLSLLCCGVKPNSKVARNGFVLTAITMTDYRSLAVIDIAHNASTAPRLIGCCVKNKSYYPHTTL